MRHVPCSGVGPLVVVYGVGPLVVVYGVGPLVRTALSLAVFLRSVPLCEPHLPCSRSVPFTMGTWPSGTCERKSTLPSGKCDK